jgi:GNAT superfamily N-acetyltransferase
MATPTTPVSISSHDSYPSEECALVDRGLGECNDAAAPLHEVQAISCFARSPSGHVIGGAVGRRWGSCCELQQLWVEPAHRHQGVASALIRAFEAHAHTHGCTSFYLETFSFQAPSLYIGLGYKVEYERTVYPHGIVKYHMGKQVGGSAPAA